MKNRVSVIWGRLALIAGLASIVILLFSLLPALAEPQAYYEGWQVIVSEDFEGSFPGTDWQVYDQSAADGGEYLWGTTTYTFSSASTSVWAVGDGTDGSLLNPATDTYTNNIDSWLVYGPIDLSEAFDARLEFDWYLDSGPNDWFRWCATTDINDLASACQGAAISGRIGTWISGTLPLTSYRLQDELWVAFQFTSNDDDIVGLGAFVDDVTIHADYGYHVTMPYLLRQPTPTPTVIPYYYDNFSNSNSGWPQVETLIPNTTSYYRLDYESGRYRISLDQGGPYAWFYQPDALAPYVPPSDKYCVEVDMLIQRGRDPYQAYNYYSFWTNAGLVFGANSANTNLYALCLSVGAEHDGSADLGWFLVNNPVYEYPRKGCSYAAGVVSGAGEPSGLDIADWQHLAVGVNGNQVKIYINGVYRGQWTMSGLSSMSRVGVIAGDYEVTPVDVLFDNFRVEPNVACTP